MEEHNKSMHTNIVVCAEIEEDSHDSNTSEIDLNPPNFNNKDDVVMEDEDQIKADQNQIEKTEPTTTYPTRSIPK
jgi:hypothetical protein